MNYTFGKSPAAQELERLLENNPIARRKITTLLSEYTDKLLKIAAMKDTDAGLLCMSLLRDHAHSRVDKKVNLSTEVRSYTKNVLTAKYRVYAETYKFVSSLVVKPKKI